MELFKSDKWLAQFLNKPCFSFSTVSIEPKYLASELANFKLAQSVDFFSSIKVATSELGMVYTLEDAGFRLVDTNVQLRLNCPTSFDNKSSSIVVRVAINTDKESVGLIARSSFKYSRFHLDPQISKEAADEIKGAWVENYFSGKRGDKMLVAELGNEIVGFVQLFEMSDHFIIDLIAVHPSHHKKGIGRILVDSCSNYYRKFSYGLVGTQISNTSSINLYERCGYRFQGSTYVFHYHHKLTS